MKEEIKDKDEFLDNDIEEKQDYKCSFWGTSQFRWEKFPLKQHLFLQS